MASDAPTVSVQLLDHSHIYSRNPPGSVDFHVRHFGPEAAGVFGEGDHALRLVRLGGQLIALSGFPEGTAPQNPPAFADGAYSHGFGIGHLGLLVESVDDAVTSLREAGVKILADPVADGDVRYAYVAAPDGVILELTQYVA